MALVKNRCERCGEFMVIEGIEGDYSLVCEVCQKEKEKGD